jgi:hypothetical protein
MPGRGTATEDNHAYATIPPFVTPRRLIFTLVSVSFVLSSAAPVRAHHVVSTPHYAYDAKYPQAPALQLTDRVGPWEVRVTGYPGNPDPGTLTELDVEVYDVKTLVPFSGTVLITIHKQRLFGGTQLVYGPHPGQQDEHPIKFHPTYPDVGNYDVTLSYETEWETSMLTFPVVVGNPGNPWMILGVFFAGFASLVATIRVVRTRMVGDQRTEPNTPS